MDYMIATRALVPTLCVGTYCSAALRPGERFPEARSDARRDAERPSMRSHAESGNERR